VRAPAWTFDAGAALWADLEAGAGLVYAGGDDGVLHALDARTGRERWRFATGGRLRARPALVASAVYLPSDDGWLYRLDAARGTLRWKVRLLPDSIVRLPIDAPGSKYDFTSSAVATAGGALVVGTHAGRVLALDPASGETLWEAATGGPVLAAPGVAGGQVFAGSFDGRVYALDADDGHVLWTHDTGAPVTSTPVPEQGVVVVGSRSYDLLGLDAATGEVRWEHYLWYSWIESTARVAGGVAYVGSSDAASVFALDPKTGALLWESDDHGLCWGRPAVTADRVIVAVRASPSIEKHEANLLALDRATGVPVWRYPCERPEGAIHRGFAASPVVLASRVFAAGLDGKVYAFELRDPRPGARRRR
jgi:outer membrane protein assembly factor BamB